MKRTVILAAVTPCCCQAVAAQTHLLQIVRKIVMSANLQMTFLLRLPLMIVNCHLRIQTVLKMSQLLHQRQLQNRLRSQHRKQETNEITKKPKVYHIPSANTTLPPIPIYFKLESNDSNGLSMSYTVENCNCNAQYDILSVTIDDMDVTSVCNKDSFEATSGTDVSGAVSIGYGNATPNSTVTFTMALGSNTDTGTTDYFDFHYSFHISEIIKE